MIALLLRDRWWLTLWLLLGATALVIALESQGFVATWVMPPVRNEELFHTGWAAGAAFGLFAAFWDPLLGIRDYLEHRPVPPRLMVQARLLGMLMVVCGWIVLAPLAHVVLQLAFGRMAGLFEFGNLWSFTATLAPAASACAIAFWAGTLPCFVLLRLAFGASALFAAFAVVHLLLETTDGGLAALAGLHALLAAAFAWLSLQTATCSADADQPWPARVRTTAGTAAAVMLAMSGAMLVAVLASETMVSLARCSPAIAKTPSGLQLVARVDAPGGWVANWIPVGDDHEPIGPPIDRDSATTLWGRRALGRVRDPGFDCPRIRGARVADGAHILADGHLHVLMSRSFGDDPRHLVLGKSDGTPFRADARLVELRRLADGSEPLLVYEPEAPTLWRYEPRDDGLVRIPLPDGDRIAAVTTVDRARDAERTIEAGNLTYEVRSTYEPLVVGERGLYQLRDGALVAAAPDVLALRERQRRARPEQIEVVDDDPLAPRVRVLQDGAIAFEHTFAAHTGTERYWVGLRLFYSCVLPPLLQAVSFAVPVAAREGHALFDPLLRGRQRAWLLLACFAAATLCAFAAARRLRRLGAADSTRRLWATWTLLLGPLGLVASILIERPRAYAAPAAAPAARPPRIASTRSPRPQAV